MCKVRYLVVLVVLVGFMGMGLGTARADQPTGESLGVPVEIAPPAGELVLEQPKEPSLSQGELAHQALACDRWTRGYWAFSCQLTYGDRNNQVRAIQLVLNCAGLDAGPVDGIFGTKTRDAVRGSQWLGGRPITGIVDAPTWRDYESRLRYAGAIGPYLLYQVMGCEAYGELFLKVSGAENGWWYVYHPASNSYVPMSRDYFNPG